MFRTALISMFLTSTALATTWTVDDDGKADFDNIQAAVDAASDGDEIVVMPGTYTGTGDAVVDMLGKAIWLHSESGPEVTIISGENVRRVIDCRNDETGQTIIEGLTITEGYDDVGILEGFGAGLTCYYSSPIVRSCHFTSNHGCRGGGCGTSFSDSVFSDCLFTNNRVTNKGFPTPWGGGLGCISSNIKVENSTFLNNTSELYGGAICAAAYDGTEGYLKLLNCQFENNSVGGAADPTAYFRFGGACMTSDVNVEISGCSFQNNLCDAGDESTAMGGAIAVGLFGDSVVKAVTIRHTTFVNNTTSSRYKSPTWHSAGGAIHVIYYGGLPANLCLIENCSFIGNVSEDGGGIANHWQSFHDIVINGSNFCENLPDHISKGGWVGEGNTFADECPPDCPDINGDGDVNVTDLLAVIDQWGLTDSPADVTGDGVVNVTDVLWIISNWGPCE